MNLIFFLDRYFLKIVYSFIIFFNKTNLWTNYKKKSSVFSFNKNYFYTYIWNILLNER